MSAVRSTDGTPIAFERTGSGPPLIIVDGALCWRESGPARKLAAELADRFTVITYDRRGRGESGDTAPYSVQCEVEDIEALIGEAGGRAHVCGISSGAVLAMEAARNGAKIDRLAVYEAPFIVDDSRPPAPSTYAVAWGLRSSWLMQWELWRQDEHGNEFLIAEFDDRAGAESARDEFIARGHHQHYWVKDLRETDAGDCESGAPAK